MAKQCLNCGQMVDVDNGETHDLDDCERKLKADIKELQDGVEFWSRQAKKFDTEFEEERCRFLRMETERNQLRSALITIRDSWPTLSPHEMGGIAMCALDGQPVVGNAEIQEAISLCRKAPTIPNLWYVLDTIREATCPTRSFGTSSSAELGD